MNINLLDNEKIQQIYANHVYKDLKFFKRYENLSEKFSQEELQLYKNIDPPRLASLIDFKEWIVKYNIKDGNNLLFTALDDFELKYLNYKSKVYVPYPPHDLHTLEIDQKNIDFCIINQTLEHLHNPLIALKRIQNHLNINGYLYITVPTINIPHMTPIHFYGYTPVGLCSLLVTCGYSIKECGYWGNKKYIDYIFSKGDWCGYEDILENDKMTYDPVCQAQTWVLAQRN